jgi:hypothetical protein
LYGRAAVIDLLRACGVSGAETTGMGFLHPLSLVQKRVVQSIGASGPVRLVEVHEKSSLEQQDFIEALNQLLRAGIIESSPSREHINPGELAQTFVNLNRAYAHDLRDLLIEPLFSPRLS